ncbi:MULTISPECIES: site-specific DNA-methyltransferase [unclassified Roseofilum]|uniref:DNA-methyltransferase n=1 Tax=unclassified Roseofilum TaxID=2620099 RepID=UPI000E923646|nr:MULTISPECIES: site-specific DNA-methyltransferase [unclassified Roseofilum]MBP0008773.1 site-specific DNA-methyltransferase [Roseofilum sp. Belize Diploria]MBP0032270.1 site-specific DNA-methyltransferase [Roseofilum sp. Belize BBD 4]HBQ99317.1 site-specific DNA-methyltransferase [Cyanobacteria bacterium UBA11691]
MKQLALDLNPNQNFEYQLFFKPDFEVKSCFESSLGILFEQDCLSILENIEDRVADVVFADPPFNLGKKYGQKSNDLRSDDEYLSWCFSWIKECCRVLKPGGSFFLYNLPKWNIILGNTLMQNGLDFRHWISVNVKSSMPIPGRLYPSHYSLLYYSKGKPNVFQKIRTPIETCRHCGKEIKDYGGHRKFMNPLGVNLTDVWNDIPPVRHWKFKSPKRKTNQLSTKLLERVIQMSSLPGNLIIDPFGGSGTTYAVCEVTGRNWIGMEIENCDVIVERLTERNLCYHDNRDYVES